MMNSIQNQKNFFSHTTPLYVNKNKQKLDSSSSMECSYFQNQIEGKSNKRESLFREVNKEQINLSGQILELQFDKLQNHDSSTVITQEKVHPDVNKSKSRPQRLQLTNLSDPGYISKIVPQEQRDAAVDDHYLLTTLRPHLERENIRVGSIIVDTNPNHSSVYYIKNINGNQMTFIRVELNGRTDNRNQVYELKGNGAYSNNSYFIQHYQKTVTVEDFLGHGELYYLSNVVSNEGLFHNAIQQEVDNVKTKQYLYTKDGGYNCHSFTKNIAILLGVVIPPKIC